MENDFPMIMIKYYCALELFHTAAFSGEFMLWIYFHISKKVECRYEITQ